MRLRNPCALLIFLMAGLFAAGGSLARQSTRPTEAQKPDAGFQPFQERVQDYLKLHKKIEATLPPLKAKESSPETIAAHQQALAAKIREARANAKEQDVFVAASQEAFRRAVRSVFQGPQGSQVRATVAEGAPLIKVRLNVNEVYPDGTPQTTVPPTLLQKLPKLPEEVEYRIVSHDLILLDVRANLVVDVFRDLLP